MTTYGRNARFVGIKSKIDELDMLINSFEFSKDTEMLAQLKKLREQLSETLDNLEKTLGDSKKPLPAGRQKTQLGQWMHQLILLQMTQIIRSRLSRENVKKKNVK